MKMTKEKADKYVHYVSRKGKALSLSPQELEKFKSAYEEIESFLQDNFVSYIVYMSAGAGQRYNTRTMKFALANAGKTGLIASIHRSVKNGDANTFVQLCSQLRANYVATVKDILDIDNALMNLAVVYAEKQGGKEAAKKINLSIENFQSVLDVLDDVMKEQGIIVSSENQCQLPTT